MLLLGEYPWWGLAKSRLPCTTCPVCLCSCLREGLYCHGIKPTAYNQLWSHADSGSGGALALSLQAKTEPGVYSGSPRATLEETWLILVPDDFSYFPTCQIPFLQEAVTWEWRSCVVDSIPVPLSESDLEAHLIINPSRLCLPLSYLRCQVNPFVPTRSSRHTFTHMLPPSSHHLVLHFCLPSPLCDYWEPGVQWKTHTMVPYDFLKLLPHLLSCPSVHSNFKSAAGCWQRWRIPKENCGQATHMP
jgi:hypothetical protein